MSVLFLPFIILGFIVFLFISGIVIYAIYYDYKQKKIMKKMKTNMKTEPQKKLTSAEKTSKKMDYIEEFVSTLLYSWGGDTPEEAYWALSDFIILVNNLCGGNLDVNYYFSSDGHIEEDKYNKLIRDLTDILKKE